VPTDVWLEARAVRHEHRTHAAWQPEGAAALSLEQGRHLTEGACYINGMGVKGSEKMAAPRVHFVGTLCRHNTQE
jgi:hypothetical protein